MRRPRGSLCDEARAINSAGKILFPIGKRVKLPDVKSDGTYQGVPSGGIC